MNEYMGMCVSVHLTVAIPIIIIIDHEYSSNTSDLNVMFGLSRIICTFGLIFPRRANNNGFYTRTNAYKRSFTYTRTHSHASEKKCHQTVILIYFVFAYVIKMVLLSSPVYLCSLKIP